MLDLSDKLEMKHESAILDLGNGLTAIPTHGPLTLPDRSAVPRGLHRRIEFAQSWRWI